jgi:O-antigen/teichoic acid export membrane protein
LLFVLSNDIALILFQRPELGGLLRLVAVVIPFGALSELLVAQLVGFRALRYKLYARDLLGSLGLLVFLIILFRLSLEATGAILAYLASFLITGTVALLLLSQLMRRKGYAVSGRSSAVKGDILQFSWPLILTKLLMIVKNNFSSLWLGYALTADQVGLYGAVFVMEPVLTVIPMSFSDILLPSLSRSVAKGDLAASRSTYNTIRRWYIKLSVPLLLAVMVFPDAVIAVVYGNQYVESAAVLRLFCLAFLIPCLAGPWVMSLLSSGRTKAIMVTQIFGALLTIGFNLLLVPSYGILGAGIAYAVAIALPNLIGTALIYPSFRFRLIDMGMIKSIGLNVGMLLLVYLLRAHLLSEYSVWLMVPVLAAYWALAVVGSFAWDGLSRQDRAVLSSFLAKAGLLRLASQVGGE